MRFKDRLSCIEMRAPFRARANISPRTCSSSRGEPRTLVGHNASPLRRLQSSCRVRAPGESFSAEAMRAGQYPFTQSRGSYPKAHAALATSKGEAPVQGRTAQRSCTNFPAHSSPAGSEG